MAITTAAQAESGAGRLIKLVKPLLTANMVSREPANLQFASTRYTGGFPAAAGAPTPGIGGETLDSTDAGCIEYYNPSSGNSYLHSLNIESVLLNSGASGCFLLLCDRLWHNSGITVTTTTAQTVNSVTWPARDHNGSTNGAGVLVGLEISTTVGGAAPITNTTVEYTNSAGDTGRVGSFVSIVNGSQATNFYVMTLASGDTGVRSIQSITLGTSYVSGALHLVAFRPIAMVPANFQIMSPNQNSASDYVQLGLPRIYDDSHLFGLVLGPGGNGNLQIYANLKYTQG